MKAKAYIIVSLAVLTAFLSCSKESQKEEWADQEELIEDFIDVILASDSTAVTVSTGKAERCTVVAGSGDELASDGNIAFYYAGYVLKSSKLSSCTLFATNNEDVALDKSWDVSDSTALNILTINMKETDLTDGLRSGLTGVQGGEECYILFTSKYGFGKKALGTIPANSPQVWHIWVESISND